MLIFSPSAVFAQNLPSTLLSPPSLPSTLPGGGALQNLPPSAQQEILQRLLDAGAGRPLGGPLPATPPQALPPPLPPLPAALPAPLPATPEEALSPVEQFFANRLTQPLRQFGYDTFRPNPNGALAGQAFGQQLNQASGALPDGYIIGRDDELVISFRGRTSRDLTQRVSR